MLRIIAIIITTLALAYAAWANSASTLMSKFSPERGLRLNPTSAQALVNVTERAKAKKDQSDFLKIARANSLTALRSEPLATRALRQLGVYYSSTGKTAEGRKLVNLAVQLSQRDTAGQLWLAEDHLRAGEYKQALTAIDVVLRTEPDSRETVFRVLGATLANPEFNRVFVEYARGRPSWLRWFIDYNVSSLPKPELISRMLVQLQPLPPEILSDSASGMLLTSLVNRSPIADARVFYLKLPNASPQSLKSLTFRRPGDSLLFPPVGWELINDGNVQGFGDIDGQSTSIEGAAAPGRHGAIARKLLFLGAGSYRWTGVADLSGLSGGAAAISILCNKGPGAWTPLARKELARGRNNFGFTVPPACEAQLIAIDIAAADSQSDASMEVGAMRLAPLGGGAPTTYARKTVSVPREVER